MHEQRKAQMRAVFDRLAPQYDAGPGCFAHFGRRLVDITGVAPGQRVLDTATGRGAVLLPAAERVGPAGEVVGIDLAEAMVRATEQEARRRGIRVTVRVMDAEHLAFPDGSFDRVFCGFGLMFFPDRSRALAECRRVLRAGGRLGVSTWQRSQAEDLAEVLRDLGLGGAGEPGWITEPAVLEQLLVDAGFQDVRVQTETASFHYADVEAYWQTARGTGLRRFLDTLDAAQTAQVVTAFGERVSDRQRSDGLHLEATALLAAGAR